MAYKINGTTVVDNSRNVCACCVTSCCITASTRLDAPSGTTANRPASPATGSLYFDTDEGSLLSYDGTDWAAVGGGGGATAIEMNEYLTNSCDALGLVFIGTRCCVSNLGGYCSSKNMTSGCGTTVIFNHYDAYQCVRDGSSSGSGKTYISWTPYWGQAPCHTSVLTALDGTTTVTTNQVCLTCNNWYNCPNTHACYLFGTVNGEGWNCLGQHCGSPASPSVHLYGGYGGASFSDLRTASNNRFCGVSTGLQMSFDEHFINTKGGVSIKKTAGFVTGSQMCSGKCFSIAEYMGPFYHHDGPWGPNLNVVGGLCDYGEGSSMGIALFTVKESSFGNSGIEVCDFAFPLYKHQDTGCIYQYGPNCFMKYTWVIPNCMQGYGTQACQRISLTPTFCATNSAFAENCFDLPSQKFILISKKIGFNSHDPAQFTCCIGGSTDSKGVSTYSTTHNACGAWLAAFKITPWCGTSACWTPGHCRITPVMSKDKCCIDFLISLHTPACGCMCLIGGYTYQSGTNTSACCTNLCMAVEVHTLNLVTGTVCHCGIMFGKCNYWIHCQAAIANGYTEACVRAYGQNPSELYACINSCCSREHPSPKAFGKNVQTSEGVWSCNSCKMYFVDSCGVSVYDGSIKAYVCHICNFKNPISCFLQNCMTKRLYQCNCWYWCGSCDTCFCTVWSKACLLSHYCGCGCSPFQQMGLNTCGAWAFCCEMLFDAPTMNDGYAAGNNRNVDGTQFMYVNPVTDHLVFLGRMFTTIGNPACRHIAWEGFLCYDLENKCLSKVHTLFPDFKSRVQNFGNMGYVDRQSVTENGTCNPGSTSCVCTGSSFSGKVYMTPDCSQYGYQLVYYHGPCRYASTEQNWGTGIAFSKQNCGCGSDFGCLCLGACILCCGGYWYTNSAFLRIPMDKPFECAGLENDCDMLKLFGVAFNQGPWVCHVWRCCTCVCDYHMCNQACYIWGSTGGFTGVTGCTTGYRWCAQTSFRAVDAATAVIHMCCVSGINTTGCCIQMCCLTCYGCRGWTESCVYKGIKNSSFPSSNPMNAVIDARASFCVPVTNIKDVGNIECGPVSFFMDTTKGDTNFTNRICRFFKEKVVCIC